MKGLSINIAEQRFLHFDKLVNSLLYFTGAGVSGTNATASAAAQVTIKISTLVRLLPFTRVSMSVTAQ